MTNEEAIKTIKTAIAEVEWNYPMDYAAVFEVAISALEKQIPKKIVTKGHFEFVQTVIQNLLILIITTLKRIVVNAVKNFCEGVIQNDRDIRYIR